MPKNSPVQVPRQGARSAETLLAQRLARDGTIAQAGEIAHEVLGTIGADRSKKEAGDPIPVGLSLSLNRSEPTNDPQVERERDLREISPPLVDREGQARVVLDHMRRHTPPGAERPWRISRNLRLVADALAGADLDEVISFVDAIAALIRNGQVERRWWYVQALFGDNLGRWLAEIAWKRGLEQDRQQAARVEASRGERRASRCSSAAERFGWEDGR